VTIDSPSLVRFSRHQALYLSVAAIVAAVFWAIGQPVNPATVVLYSLCFGNFITPPLIRIRRRLAGRPSVHSWLIFLAALVILTPPVYVLSSVIVWWLAPPTPQSLSHLITTGWKLPSLVIVVFGVLWFLYNETKERLERRNAELQRSVELGAARLEMQEQELERAREIQQSLLPKEIPQLPGFEVTGAWLPARVVGGDYYDVLRLSETRLAICIADVVGKGVSAALLMANVQASVRAFARDSESPARVCGRTNDVLCANIATGKFVTFFYAVLDTKQRTLHYCNAGHPYPLLVSADSLRQLALGGPVLGVFPSWEYQDAVAELRSGDRLFLFTDGITEASESDGQEFGDESVAAFAQSHRRQSASELNRRLLAQVTNFCHSQFQDDVTLLVVAVN
jgi:sigma-B regulation protein RsbU (phosphoserine phosphatase)